MNLSCTHHRYGTHSRASKESNWVETRRLLLESLLLLTCVPAHRAGFSQSSTKKPNKTSRGTCKVLCPVFRSSLKIAILT